MAAAQRSWDIVWGSPWNDVTHREDVTSLDVHEPLPDGMPIVGQEALARRVANWKTRMPDLIFTPVLIFSGETYGIDAVVTGIHAVKIRTATGRPSGPYPILDFAGRPDAKPQSWQGTDIFRIACGQVEEVCSKFDMDRLDQAIRGE